MRVYGLETEYGLTARTRPLGNDDPGRRWHRLASDDAASRLFAPLAQRHATTNLFLPNGGRLYLDVGNHPEYATPECTSIDDLLVADRAGDEVLLELASDAAALEADEGRQTEFVLYRNNVDSFGNTYGSHENYLVSREADPRLLSDWLVPFLVSRQAIAGAGRWQRGSFTVSQRCDVLADVVSNTTTRQRPLINTRDEPHADPAQFRRLHVISGDSNCDESSAWLKLAASELVLRLAETGRPCPIVLDDPMSALRAWGRDPGGAIELQTRYAALAEGVVDEPLAAAWEAWRSGTVVPEWRHKKTLIDGYRARHGLDADDARLDAVDLRWHAVGDDEYGRPRGWARLLESRGVLPRLTKPDAVASARLTAPSPGRARLRGTLVAAAQRHDRDHVADWASFTVHDLPHTLALDDPFAIADARVDELSGRMAGEPRRRPLGGFAPPPQ